jgi:hypothetical protein
MMRRGGVLDFDFAFAFALAFALKSRIDFGFGIGEGKLDYIALDRVWRKIMDFTCWLTWDWKRWVAVVLFMFLFFN